MNWITDFDTGCGTFSSGFEDGRDYAVLYNYGLKRDNTVPYNNNHLKEFVPYDDDKQFSDFFICAPHLGNRISRRGRANFDIYELNHCLALISLNNPDTVLISILKNGFYSLNDPKLNSDVYYTVDGYPSQDFVVAILSQCGYYVDRFVVDEANFGIPQHKEFVVYVAQKKDFDPLIKQINKYRDNKLAKPIDFLKQFDKMNSIHIWNHIKDYQYNDICSKIKPGSNAKATKDISQVSGYYRMRPDVPCNSLHHDFYRVSSRGPSIHPVEDRPLTILEGAYLSGIYMNLWEQNVDKKIAGDMIARAMAPSLARKIKKVVVQNLV